jgi:hypothetical protein
MAILNNLFKALKNWKQNKYQTLRYMNKRKILIVDDELNIRETIEELHTITNYDTKH